MKLLIRLLWVIGAIAFAQTPEDKSHLWGISSAKNADRTIPRDAFCGNKDVSTQLSLSFSRFWEKPTQNSFARATPAPVRLYQIP
ncbi:hypothetical protein [Flavobacterium sp.]|uniref:hypothetical protein n=1 Tax=Flavobacterium sp. TaxID=239 RepID=UPI00261A7BF3|nr:hypothetical protein [Flavobacterium sp.]